MRFAVLALLGVVAADVQLPEVDVDTDKVNAAMKDVDAWAKRHKAAKEEDDKKNLESLAHAAATYRVQEAVNFRKAWHNWAKFEVTYMEAVSVNTECNQEVCTDCITNWIMKGADPKTKHAETEMCCREQAGCYIAWDKYSPQKQEAIKGEYRTAVNDISTTYKEINRKTEADAMEGWKAHQERKAAMKADFKATAKKFAGDMGCDTQCLHDCIEKPAKEHQCCMSKCHCGKGVIRITEPEKPVNVAAIVEDAYGDLNQLTDADLINIDQALASVGY